MDKSQLCMFAASKKVLGQDSTDYTGQVKGSQHVTVKLDIDVRREVMRGGSEYHDDYCTLLSLAALAALSLVNSDGECSHATNPYLSLFSIAL